MHDVLVTMKTGEKYCGPIWVYSPSDGYMQLVGDGPEKIWLRDVASAVGGSRNTSGEIKIDYLADARKHGWNGT